MSSIRSKIGTNAAAVAIRLRRVQDRQCMTEHELHAATVEALNFIIKQGPRIRLKPPETK